MTDVPTVRPETMPLVLPTVAMAGLELLQLPPGVASAREIEAPAQTEPGPVMGLIMLRTSTVAEPEVAKAGGTHVPDPV